MGCGTAEVYSEVRKKLDNFVAFDRQDYKMHEHIDQIKQLLASPPPTNVTLLTDSNA